MRSSFTILSLCFCLNCHAFTVVIDPGHGGIDAGASRGSFVESQIVFQIAERISTLLKQNPEVDVHLTRPKNKGASLADRVQFADSVSADLFLSLHANSSPSLQVSGIEYYFNSKKTVPVLLKKIKPENEKLSASEILKTIKSDLVEFGKTKASLDLSKTIQSVWNSNAAEKSLTSNSKIRRAPFFVVENTSMPSVLVEVGFISNQREARKLVSPKYQDELACALTAAIVKYKEKSDK